MTTVKELIEALSKCDPDAPVLTPSGIQYKHTGLVEQREAVSSKFGFFPGDQADKFPGKTVTVVVIY